MFLNQLSSRLVLFLSLLFKGNLYILVLHEFTSYKMIWKAAWTKTHLHFWSSFSATIFNLSFSLFSFRNFARSLIFACRSKSVSWLASISTRYWSFSSANTSLNLRVKKMIQAYIKEKSDLRKEYLGRELKIKKSKKILWMIRNVINL